LFELRCGTRRSRPTVRRARIPHTLAHFVSFEKFVAILSNAMYVFAKSSEGCRLLQMAADMRSGIIHRTPGTKMKSAGGIVV
jgi:hypothetical protein